MPKYVYRCTSCEQEFEIFHSMSETLDKCNLCEAENTIHRIPQMTSDPKKIKNKTKKVGQTVREYIQDAADEIKQEKKKRMKLE